MRKTRSECLQCRKTVENLRSKYCSNKCQMEKEYLLYIERWKVGEETGNRNGKDPIVAAAVKRYLREKFSDSCTKCGWSQKHPVSGIVPLHAEHLDGDARNTTEENLTLLCPNCHSLTPSFGALNRGRGRKLGAVVQREDATMALLKSGFDSL